MIIEYLIIMAFLVVFVGLAPPIDRERPSPSTLAYRQGQLARVRQDEDDDILWCSPVGGALAIAGRDAIRAALEQTQ